MKISFKTLDGKKVNNPDLVVDMYGKIYEISDGGHLYAKTGIIAQEDKRIPFKSANKTIDLSGRTAYKW